MNRSECYVRLAELELAKAQVILVAACERLDRHRAAADPLPPGAVAEAEVSYRLALLDVQVAEVRLELARRPCQVESPTTKQGEGK